MTPSTLSLLQSGQCLGMNRRGELIDYGSEEERQAAFDAEDRAYETAETVEATNSKG